MKRKRWWPLTLLIVLVLGALTSLSLAASGLGGRSLGGTIDDAVEDNRFSVFDFETESLFNRWLGEVGAFFAGRRDSGANADRILERYFTLSNEIVSRSDSGSDGPETVTLRRERRELENRAERILEDRVAQAYRAAGFARSLPLFGGQSLLWPPIDVELSRPPRVLAVSPRDEIRLLRSVLLDPDLSRGEVNRIEAELEADGQYSAFVDTIGGFAAYPAIVRETRSYASTVETIAHEWLHHYLFFYPLGRAFFESNDLRTINETVADIIAAEIAADVFAAYPDVRPPAPTVPDRSETDAILRQLRLNVDALLAQGRVEEAERLMKEVRLDLEAKGRHFRRINQAFFAVNGVYATTPASSSPIGPLLRELRAESPSVEDFARVVREVTSLAQLQSVVAADR